jgi:hypothetical protein
MNPWITGRIIETMQQEARNQGHQSRLGREAALHRAAPPERARAPEAREPRRERFGLAVARFGLRLAGRCADLRITPAPLHAPSAGSPLTRG